jgi:hypothetical protein
MYETDRRSFGRAAAGRILSLGLAGITALMVAQACKTEPPEDGDGAGGSGGSMSTGGSGGGAEPMTGGSGGNSTGGNDVGGSAGNGGLGGQGGHGGELAVDFAAVSGISTVYSFSSSVLGGALLIDRQVSCGTFVSAGENDAYFGNSQSLLLSFGDQDLTELEPGTYPVTDLPAPAAGKYGSATLVEYDDECADTTSAASAGSITLTAIDGDEISGSYDLVFSGGSLTGTFSPEPCDDFAWSDDSPPTTCY